MNLDQLVAAARRERTEPGPVERARIRASLARRLRDGERERGRLGRARLRSPGTLALVVAMMLFVGSVFAREWHRRTVAAPLAAAPSAVPVARAPARALAPPRPEPTDPPAAEERPPVEHRTPPRAAPQVPPPLDAEMAALHGARDALHRKEPAAALVALDAYEARFRAGTMTQEARALRISALCDLGKEEDARELGRQFLRRWPHSPLAARVRSTCDVRAEPPR